MKKGVWRFYVEYLKTETRDDAERVLRGAAEASPDHLVRLAVQFAGDYGRLPDELHNMMMLSGGPEASKYAERLAKYGTVNE